MTTEQTAPDCKFADGCQRVVACDPGCAVTNTRLHAQLAAATGDQTAEEAYRLAVSTALGLGTGANWEACRDRAEDLVAEVGQLTESRRRLGLMVDEYGQGASALADKLRQLREIGLRLAAHAVGFQDVLDDSDRGPWARTVGADIAELGKVLEAPAPVPPVSGRAATLNEAADFFRGLSLTGTTITTQEAEAELRRLAGEARQDSTPGGEIENNTGSTEEQIVRNHVTTLHLIGDQLSQVESWMWEHLAYVRAQAVGPATDAFAVTRLSATVPMSGQRYEDAQEGAVLLGRAADEQQTLRLLRRESLLVILSRLQRGRPVTAPEADTLRLHVETEIREADTARTVAAGNKRHVQVMYEELEAEQKASRGLAEKIREQREALDAVGHKRDVAVADLQTADLLRVEAQRDRDQHAAVLTEVLDGFSRVRTGQGFVVGHQGGNVDPDTFDRWSSTIAPTVEDPWWNTVAEVRAELAQAQAAIERVRGFQQWLRRNHPSLTAVRARLSDALDGDEPTTEAPEPPEGNFAAYQAAIARVVLVLREAQQHREQTDPSERQDCVMCGADHLAEIRDAIKGKKPNTGV
ncbi:hypothetical protein [Streptomyces sp. NPDC101455]|uniref:hypothetical protein n=1 Tax=Streptomyces sp. NPDC101455 TaxID=3366142 RepID=UPI00380401B8